MLFIFSIFVLVTILSSTNKYMVESIKVLRNFYSLPQTWHSERPRKWDVESHRPIGPSCSGKETKGTSVGGRRNR